MKTFLIAIVLAASTLNAFATSEHCAEVEGKIQTEMGEFEMRAKKYSEVSFTSEDHIYGVSDHYTSVVLAGGMKKNKDGFVVPLVPVQYKPLFVAADAADFIIDKFSKYVFDIKTHEYSREYESMRVEQYPDDMFRIPLFSSDEQPMFAKSMIRKISKKLDQVKVDAENEKFISCAKEQLQKLHSKI